MIMEQQQLLSTTRVANPLAGSSSNEIDFPSDSATSDAVVSNGGGGVSAVVGAGSTTPSGVPNPMSSGVPNPIMGASPIAMDYNNARIAPSPMVSKKTTAPTTTTTAGAPFTSTTPMTSLVPSPLASPSSSPPHQPQQDEDEMEEETRDTSCDEPPKKEQRRRPSSIQWATAGGGAQHHPTNNNPQESLEPVNFGDYREASPRKDSIGSWASSCASHDTSSTHHSTHPPTPLSPATVEHIQFGAVDPPSAAGTPSTSATTTTAGAAASGGPSLPHFAPSSDAATATITATTTTTIMNNKQQQPSPTAVAAAAPTTTTGIIVDKRQKRLERNRESARASRRRRKQYLEELEHNVHTLSTEMDSGRVHHALEGVKVVTGLREQKVLEILERWNDTLYDDIDMNGGGGNVFANKSSSSSGVKHNVIPKTTAAPTHHQRQQSSSSSSRGLLLQNANIILATSLSRTQPSFQVVNAFFQQQLKSLILTHKQPITTSASSSSPHHPASAAASVVAATASSPILGPLLPSLTPFILWLTLQNDNFFRGGRGQSERLSAARIGERLLHGGLYRVTPSTTAVARQHSSNSSGGGTKSATATSVQQQQQQQQHNDSKGTVLWPLLCHEIGLSYDQEDKIRTAQRLVLQNVDLWIHRHTARATSNVIQSVHDVIGGMMELTRKNEECRNNNEAAAGLKREEEEWEEEEESLLSILTEEQRMKFWGWALKNRERMKQCAERNVGTNDVEVGEELEVSNERHVAANMYIIAHKLGKIQQRVPPIGGKYAANPPKLMKKLGRRPCFESLGGYEKDNNDAESSSAASSKMSRHDSTGSLKRSLDDMSIGGTSSTTEMNLTAVTPEAGQAAGHAAASSLLKDVLEIIPKPPSIQYQYHHHHPLQLHQQTHAQHFEPEPVMSALPAPVMSATFPSSQSQQQQQQQQHHKALSSTFDDIPMPTPVSVLLQTADDFLTPTEGGVNDIMGVDPTAVIDHPIPPTAVIDPIPFVPEAVGSSSVSMISRHQSAPEFGQYLNHHPSPQMGMVPVPEEDDEDDFILDDLPMDADDWLIGDDTLEF